MSGPWLLVVVLVLALLGAQVAIATVLTWRARRESAREVVELTARRDAEQRRLDALRARVAEKEPSPTADREELARLDRELNVVDASLETFLAMQRGWHPVGRAMGRVGALHVELNLLALRQARLATEYGLVGLGIEPDPES
ncbi:MAG: hypothetical protein AAGE94_10180 [Acidobacteriota bacterium]